MNRKKKKMHHAAMLCLSPALGFSQSWILLVEGQLVYGLQCPAGSQNTAMIGQRGRLLISPTPAPIYQKPPLYSCYSWCQEYERTRLDAEQNCKSNNYLPSKYSKDHECRQGFRPHVQRRTWCIFFATRAAF